MSLFDSIGEHSDSDSEDLMSRGSDIYAEWLQEQIERATREGVEITFVAASDDRGAAASGKESNAALLLPTEKMVTSTADNNVSDYAKTHRRGKMNAWVLDRKLKRLERLQKMSCNYERVLAKTSSLLLGGKQAMTDSSTPQVRSLFCQRMIANRSKPTQEEEQQQQAGTLAAMNIDSSSLLKRVQDLRANIRSMRFENAKTRFETGHEQSVFDGFKAILDEQKRHHSDKQKRLEELREANAAAERASMSSSMGFRRSFIHYPQKCLSDDMSAITTPSTFDASMFAESLATPSLCEADKVHISSADMDFDASIFAESVGSSSSLEADNIYISAANMDFDASIFAESVASSSSYGGAKPLPIDMDRVQVEFEKADKRLSEVIQEIELLDNNSEHSSIADRKSNATEFNEGDEDAASTSTPSFDGDGEESEEEDGEEETSSEGLRYVKGSFDVASKDGESEEMASTASFVHGSGGLIKGKFDLRDDSITEVTVATTQAGSFDEQDNDTTPSDSESESDDESSNASEYTANEVLSEYQTTPSDEGAEDQRMAKMVEDMKVQVKNLQRERNVTEKTAQVFLDGYKTETNRLVEENEMLEDDKNTMYAELKDLLLKENMEAERLQQRLSVLNKSQSTMKRCLVAAVVFLSLAFTVYLHAPSHIEGLCAPSRPGTRLVDPDHAESNREDNNTEVIGEAPWWVPEEYSWWKQPVYDLVGCPSPRTQIELKRGMLWVTQPSTGKVLLKKPSTTVYVRGDSLHILDQRVGQHLQIQAPWSIPAGDTA